MLPISPKGTTTPAIILRSVSAASIALLNVNFTMHLHSVINLPFLLLDPM